jgi:hypothetical protein
VGPTSELEDEKRGERSPEAPESSGGGTRNEGAERMAKHKRAEGFFLKNVFENMHQSSKHA